MSWPQLEQSGPPAGNPGPTPGNPRPFGWNTRPIEELNLPFDPRKAEQKMSRRRRRMRSRLISLLITVVILAVLYFWQRDQLSRGGFIALYAVLLGVSAGWFVLCLVGYLQARHELARVGTGTALRISRTGVEISGTSVSWPEVRTLSVASGKLGRSPLVQLTLVEGRRLTVPLDQIDVRPATLDLTARAYSAGRHGVDLQALDS